MVFGRNNVMLVFQKGGRKVNIFGFVGMKEKEISGVG